MAVTGQSGCGGGTPAFTTHPSAQSASWGNDFSLFTVNTNTLGKIELYYNDGSNWQFLDGSDPGSGVIEGNTGSSTSDNFTIQTSSPAYMYAEVAGSVQINVV